MVLRRSHMAIISFSPELPTCAGGRAVSWRSGRGGGRRAGGDDADEGRHRVDVDAGGGAEGGVVRTHVLLSFFIPFERVLVRITRDNYLSRNIRTR